MASGNAMYRYDAFDHRLVHERVAQFRDQTRRFLIGDLSEDDFRPLRLQNGLYIQKHAPMLRISIPYGSLSSPQLRMLARISRVHDRGYGHFTTRQNLQINWPRLEDVPNILADPAGVGMHAIQTSGNCVRNITSDHFAGVAGDEIVDPRPYCELVRQWAALHPEFAYLPRKFKIAITGATHDRAAILVHDIGLALVRNAAGDVGFRVAVGGGLGRTPVVGHVIREFLPRAEILNYLDAILRTYNRFGRRDNKWKARIKILVKERTAERFAVDVEAEWTQLQGGPATVPADEFDRLAAFFDPPPYVTLGGDDVAFKVTVADNRAFANWVKRNVHPHKIPGYAIVTLSLKRIGVSPGDATSDQMDAVADLADDFSFSELAVSHEQNLILRDVRQSDLFALWSRAKPLGLATPNIGLLTDIVCDPGGEDRRRQALRPAFDGAAVHQQAPRRCRGEVRYRRATEGRRPDAVRTRAGRDCGAGSRECSVRSGSRRHRRPCRSRADRNVAHATRQRAVVRVRDTASRYRRRAE